jgi:1,4-alpha-glucan branching enzyme
VVSLLRTSSDGDFVVALFNFTPVPRDGYRVGVPAAGSYRELINSDSEIYGGSNLGNAGVAFTEPIAAHGFDDSLRLNLPPLAFLLQASRQRSTQRQERKTGELRSRRICSAWRDR